MPGLDLRWQTSIVYVEIIFIQNNDRVGKDLIMKAIISFIIINN